MKLFKNIQNRARRRNVRGFTLVEMVITVGVFLFIFVGVMVAVQIFGLRIYTLAATKLVATAGGRQALNQIRDQLFLSYQLFLRAHWNDKLAAGQRADNLSHHEHDLVLDLLSGHQHHDQSLDPI